MRPCRRPPTARTWPGRRVTGGWSSRPPPTRTTWKPGCRCSRRTTPASLPLVWAPRATAEEGDMRQWHSERGNVLLMSVIVILAITVIGLAVVRYSSREVSAAIAGRKEAAVTACAEAARSLLMSQWKLLSAHGTSVAPLNVTLDTASQTQIQGGHYGQNPR